MQRQNYLQSWEQAAHYIRQNSSPDEGLYVWGWVPGIYVQAQRFCPARMPAYSSMHSDEPDLVRKRIAKLVRDLQAHPPKYIVDSQHIHYPYYEHPNFDLWPRWRDSKKKGFDLRRHPSQGMEKTKLLSLNEINKVGQALLASVENYTYLLLTDSKRKGGSLQPDKAREMAQKERARHKAMVPLRQFVMENYKPVYNFSNTLLYERKNH